MFVHRRPRITTRTQLKEFLDNEIWHFSPDIICGDMNENVNSTSDFLKEFLDRYGYKLVTNADTTVAGTAIDVVFTKGSDDVQVFPVESPFFESHHLPLWVGLDEA